MEQSVFFERQPLGALLEGETAEALVRRVAARLGVPAGELYAVARGRRAAGPLAGAGPVRVLARLPGGKGGFGSMLRAIGAQIEKTTNREACRDLSGRRLRDINEEQRLRKWLDAQPERERDATDRKLKRLERLCAEPKLNTSIDDPVYENERQALPERVSAAVDAGWQAAASSSTTLKRKADEPAKTVKKKKLWIDADLSDCSTGSESEEEVKETKTSVSEIKSDRTSENSKVTVL